jgi:hypothetical protein
MSNQSRQNQQAQSKDVQGVGVQGELSGAALIIAASPLARADAGLLAPGLTVAHFTARELETLRKACRDSDYEHLWRDFVQPAIARAELGK